MRIDRARYQLRNSYPVILPEGTTIHRTDCNHPGLSRISHFLPVFDPTVANAPTVAVLSKSLQAHLPNSFLYEFDNIHVTSDSETSDFAWHVVENPAFVVMLDGHFYLKDVPVLDVNQNLRKFLYKISVSTLENGLHQIAGGLFNLIIIDKERKQLFVTGDRNGWMPLYYLHSENGFFLSGNQFAFRKICKVSEEAVVEFLKYGYLPFAPSVFQQVERRLPGQMLRFDLQTQAFSKTASRVAELRPPQFREDELPAAGAALHDALGGYFSRFTEADYHIALYDDYASQLLVSWLHSFRPKLWDRDAARNVLKLANHYQLPVRSAPVNCGKLPEIAADLRNASRLMISLEHYDVFDWQDTVSRSIDGWIVDEFSGDAHIGAQAYFDVPANFREMLSYLRGEQNFNNPIRSIDYYQRMLYNEPNAIPDEALQGILTLDYECWYLNAARGVLEINRLAGHTHEDFRESLYHYTRLRCLSAAHAIGVQQHARCASPFFDYNVMETCQNIDKNLRVNDRLYNYYWSTYFPEAAFLPGELWGRSPIDAPQVYRFKEAARLISRQIGAGNMNLAIGQKRANPKNVARRMIQEGNNRAWLEDTIRFATAPLPDFIFDQMARKGQRNKQNPRLSLRYATLVKLLND